MFFDFLRPAEPDELDLYATDSIRNNLSSISLYKICDATPKKNFVIIFITEYQ